MCAHLVFAHNIFCRQDGKSEQEQMLPVDGTRHLLFCTPRAIWKASHLEVIHTESTPWDLRNIYKYFKKSESTGKKEKSLPICKLPSHWFKVSSVSVITAPLCLLCDTEVLLLEPTLLELNVLNFFGNVGCTQHLPAFNSQKLSLFKKPTSKSQ